MNDERLRDAYERTLPRGDVRAPLDDVAAERLRRLIEREGSEEERLHTVDALLSSAEGRRDLDIVWAAARAARIPRRVRRGWLVAASVLVVIGLGGAWWTTQTASNLERSDDGSRIALIAPVGTMTPTTRPRFIWRAVSGAERYDLSIVNSAGDPLFAAETRDTVVALPDSVVLAPGSTFLWWVRSTTGNGAQLTARTQRVSISAR